MPKYRQLHLKILDSQDFADMPDDFTRVTWMLAPLIVDSAGRGIYNPAWIRSKMYPLRDDVTIKQVDAAFKWLVQRGMIEIYTVEGRQYFWLPTFSTYQTRLASEAPSSLPEPPKLEVGDQQVIGDGEAADFTPLINSLIPSSSLNLNLNPNESAEPPTPVPPPIPTPPPHPPSLMQILARASGLSAMPPKETERLEQIQCLIDAHGEERVEAALKKACDKWVITPRREGGGYYKKTNMSWVDWAQEELDNHASSDRGLSRAAWNAMSQDERTKHILAGKETPT